jgi:hypothetical protein
MRSQDAVTGSDASEQVFLLVIRQLGKETS